MYQKKYEEALKVLQDPRTGFASAIGKTSWTLALLLIELQGLCGQVEPQWQTCHQILESAMMDPSPNDPRSDMISFGKRGDDWRVWSSLIASASSNRSQIPV